MAEVNKYLLLVYGFAREMYSQYNLGNNRVKLVPCSIIKLIYAYNSHFDSWDDEYISNVNKITLLDPYCARTTSADGCTLYGKHIVDSDRNFCWILHLKYKGYGFGNKSVKVIGLIKNDIAWLKTRQNRSNWHLQNGGYSFDTSVGRVMPIYRYYGRKRTLENSGDIIKIILRDSTLSYSVNGQDLGVAINKLLPYKYRLCVYLSGCSGALIELL
eukprot:1138303_1